MSDIQDLQNKIDKLQIEKRNMMKKKLYGRTQKWLSEVTGIKASRLNAWINAVNELDAEEITKIVNALSKYH